MEYTNINGYLVPNLTLNEQPMQPIGKYGSLRKEFLRENYPMTFEELTVSGNLYRHLLEVEKTVRQEIEQAVKSLLQKNPAPDRKTDPLGWTQHMNNLKLQAEELAMLTLYNL